MHLSLVPVERGGVTPWTFGVGCTGQKKYVVHTKNSLSCDLAVKSVLYQVSSSDFGMD